MSAAVATRPRRPELARNTLPSFMAALAMHALLVAGMWFAVQWRTSSEAPAVAELWAPLPSVEPTPVVQPPAPVQPPPPPAPPQPEAAKPEADIVIKQHVKPHAPEQESPPPVERRPVEKREPKKTEKKVEARPTAKQLERERQLAEQMRQSEIARLTGEAAGSPTGTARTPFASTGVVSNAYGALVKACIRPHIVFAVPEGTPDNVYAEFKVELLPTGEQAAPPQLTKPSGLPGYDDAAERAIIRCDPFPRNSDGTVPRTFTLKMYPTEAR